MYDPSVSLYLRAELHRELTEHLLPFWAHNTIDHQFGGFVGKITGDGRVQTDAPKSAILNTRILWMFSAAYAALGNEQLHTLAERAFQYLLDHFWDRQHNGLYWSLNADGSVLDNRKHIYAQAFGIFSLANHYLATGKVASLNRARVLFSLIERYGADVDHGGYHEAFSHDWNLLDDVRLSEKDLNEPKSMNTHLHILEAYTILYRAWPDPLLYERLENLVLLFLNNIIDPETGHLYTFFDVDWCPRTRVFSFGHDIEASWLLMEAADVLKDDTLNEHVHSTACTIARTTLREGVDSDGGLFNEVDETGHLDSDKHWWPQAEAIVGFYATFQKTRDSIFENAAARTWKFIKHYIIDQENGEWFTRVNREGIPYAHEDKVGFWKCPYHNVRACLEILTRTNDLVTSSSSPDEENQSTDPCTLL